jgi:hypothetical protein
MEDMCTMQHCLACIQENDTAQLHMVPALLSLLLLCCTALCYSLRRTIKHQALSKKEVVFARTSPQQKLEIVIRAQAMGHVVGMTGDGVNDRCVLCADVL